VSESVDDIIIPLMPAPVRRLARIGRRRWDKWRCGDESGGRWSPQSRCARPWMITKKIRRDSTSRRLLLSWSPAWVGPRRMKQNSKNVFRNLLGGLAAGLFASIPPAFAGARITVGFDSVEVEISPRKAEHRSHYENTYLISGSKTVSYASSGGMQGAGSLGQSMTVIDQVGAPNRVTYRVSGGAIVVSWDKPAYTIVTRITTDGSSSCSATRAYIRKPGHQFFETVRLSNHEKMVDSEMRSENITCAIQQTSN
jgi:hypothetical protein